MTEGSGQQRPQDDPRTSAPEGGREVLEGRVIPSRSQAQQQYDARPPRQNAAQDDPRQQYAAPPAGGPESGAAPQAPGAVPAWNTQQPQQPGLPRQEAYGTGPQGYDGAGGGAGAGGAGGGAGYGPQQAPQGPQPTPQQAPQGPQGPQPTPQQAPQGPQGPQPTPQPAPQQAPQPAPQHVSAPPQGPQSPAGGPGHQPPPQQPQPGAQQPPQNPQSAAGPGFGGQAAAFQQRMQQIREAAAAEEAEAVREPARPTPSAGGRAAARTNAAGGGRSGSRPTPPASGRVDDPGPPDWNALADQAASGARRKKTMTLVGALVAVVVVAGGVATAVVMSGKSSDDKTIAGPTTGSSTASQQPLPPTPSFSSVAPPPPANPLDYIGTAAKDKAPLTPDSLFPGKQFQINGHTYVKTASASTTSCASAARDAVAAGLTANKCHQMIRATYTNGAVAITLGVAVFDDAKHAAKLQGTAPYVAPLNGGGVKDFCHAVACQMTSNAVGRYAYFAISGYKNGQTLPKTDTVAKRGANEASNFAFQRIIQRGRDAAAADPNR